MWRSAAAAPSKSLAEFCGAEEDEVANSESGLLWQFEMADSFDFGDGSNDEARMESSSQDSECEFCEEPKWEWGWGCNNSTGECEVPKDKSTHLRRSSFLTHPDLTHEGLVKVIGYCYEGKTKSIIYDVNTLDRLEHYILREDYCGAQACQVLCPFA
ncbi:hypothetical protein M9H77_10332 [Catharanthus roseus]|uniref:Uncharacterized protein n=1 Tax=Catharanthus roseus TaxID=4058 RepID=A0ACC0C3C7_CATRO|nr:hypothetical protein M9H77_10332 [Catharanthus roseus]